MSENELFKNDDIEKKIRSYLPSPFISAALPLRDVHKHVFERKYNNITLYLQGLKNVPFGKYGRLLLSVITTHAVISEDSECVINYKNLNELLSEMQLPKQRGKDIKEQLDLFSKSSFSYEQKVSKRITNALFKEMDYDKENFMATAVRYENIPFCKGISYVECDDGSEKKNYIAFSVNLSRDFVDFCKGHSVPIDYTVYKDITSPLGKDIYAWLIYRNNIMDNLPLFIKKEDIINQFMPVSSTADYNATINVNWKYIKDMIEDIKKKYYPELKYEVSFEGLTLYKSRAVINEDDKRYVLITAGGSVV